MKRLAPIRDERGTTLVELTVGIAAGVVILFAISMVLIVSLRETHRASARIDATQRARITLSKVVDQLHSACIAPQIAPVQTGSTGTSLRFIHQAGSEVAPVPILSTVSLSGSTLSQSDYKSTGGTAPKWEFAASPYSTRQLMTKIAPIAPSSSIFSYYSYTNGQVSATPLAVPLSAENAVRTVQVGVAFTASASSTPVPDSHGPVSVQNTAVLRLTPASFSSSGVNLPCQ